jgi:predicted nucleic acid-binding protein
VETLASAEWIGIPWLPSGHYSHLHEPQLEPDAAENQAAGLLLTDAVLAAVAVEHGATLASTDRGFARFEGLRWVNPLKTNPLKT